uniref:Uncharacterized protein n=1 Tax=Marseillevirus LCMAC201 TaxID=2506605 RepID=A0A481YW69_9VIRU|nr:MAG: hypothetical protein LCMAC201_01720 [Marseillevirus LCMAC201]
MKYHRKKQERILTDCGLGIWYRINLKTDHELRAIFNKVNFIDWSDHDYYFSGYVKKALICKNTGDIIYLKAFANINNYETHETPETQSKEYQIGEVLDQNLSLYYHEVHMLRYIKKHYRIPYALTHQTLMRLVIQQNYKAQICEEMENTVIGNFFQLFLNLPLELKVQISDFL